jgi:beta-lactamase regulating signal transducer with metallopeptidase domain
MHVSAGAGSIASLTLSFVGTSALRGLLLLAAAEILWLLVRRRASAAANHMILTTALLGLLAIPVISVVAPVWRLPCLPLVAGTTLTPRPKPAPDHREDVTSAAFHARALATGAQSPRRELRAPASAAFDPGNGARATLPRGPAATAGSASWTSRWLPAPVAALLFWLLGVAGCAAKAVAGRLELSSFARRAPILRDGALYEAVADVARTSRAPRAIVVRQAPDSDEVRLAPMTWGWLRPTLLLPGAAVLDGWPSDRLRAAVLHEMAHITRCDWLTQALAQAAVALNWMNPLAWLVLRQIGGEAERACDDQVMLCGIGAPAYADHLLAVVRSLKRSSDRSRHTTPTFMGAQAMAREHSPIQRRIRSILASDQRRVAASRWAAIGAAGLGAALVGPLAAVQLSARMLPASHNRGRSAIGIPLADPDRSRSAPASRDVTVAPHVAAWSAAAPTPAAAGRTPLTSPPAVTALAVSAPQIQEEAGIAAAAAVSVQTPEEPVASRPRIVIRERTSGDAASSAPAAGSIAARSDTAAPAAVPSADSADAVAATTNAAAAAVPSQDSVDSTVASATTTAVQAMMQQVAAVIPQVSDESDGSGGEGSHDMKEVTVTTDAAAPKLVVQNDRGSIEVVPGPDGAVHVQEELHASSTENLQKMSVSVTNDQGTVHVTFKMPEDLRSDHQAHVRLKITAPAGSDLELNTLGGSIAAAGAFRNGLTADTAGGAISVRGVAGALHLTTAGGGIEVTGAAGEVHAVTAGGAIQVAGALAGYVVAHTSGGPISVRSTSEAPIRLDAKTVGGPIVVSAALSGDNEIDTNGGPIAVTLPVSANLTVDATTAGGPVSNAFGLTVTTKDGRATMTGAIGAGTGGHLHIATQGGPISLSSKG